MPKLMIGSLSALKYIRCARLGNTHGTTYVKAFGARSRDLSNLIKRARDLCCESDRLHVFVPSARDRPHYSSDLSIHIWGGTLPDSPYTAIDTGIYVANAPLAFVQAACELDTIDLALVAYELTGTYAIRFWDDGASISVKEPITTLEELKAFARTCVALGARGANRAIQALELVVPMSNSAAESALALMLMEKGCRGGLALRDFNLNERIKLPHDIARLHGYDALTPDYHFINSMILLEYESDAYHLTSNDKARDSRRSVAFGLAGYRTFPLSKQQVQDPEYLWELAEQLRLALGRRKLTRNWEQYVNLHHRLFIQRRDPLRTR